MKFAKISRRVLVILLAAAWIVYAAVNLVACMPYLTSAYNRTWGSTTEKLAASAEAANGKILLQSMLQDVNGDISLMLDRNSLNNFTLIKGEDGQLIYTSFYPYETHAEYNEYAQKMRQLSLAAQEQGASFTYLNCIDLYNEEAGNFGDLPASDLNPRSDAFLRYLSGYGVDTLDARAVLKASSLDPSEYVYKTEPHWTIQASFEVYAGLVEALKTQGSDIDPDAFFTDLTNYSQTLYPQSYLGKLGKIAGATYSGYDDFMLIAPKFETDFTISYASTDSTDDVRGDFASTILDMNWISHDDVYDNDLYCTYLSEVYTYRKITNHLNEEGPKILVLGDSYMLPVSAFLATTASEIHLLSPYSLPDNAQSLLEYISNNEFDHIVVGLTPGTLYDTGWSFLDNIDAM